MRKIALIVGISLLSGCGFNTVGEGWRGIETNFGKVVGEPLSPGLHFYNPLTSSIFEMDVREHKLEMDESCFTRDTQSVKVGIVLTFYPKQDQIGVLYSQFGEEWQDKIVKPAVQTSVKDIIGQFIADDLVGKREIARETAFKELVGALAPRHVIATRLDFVNLDFDDAYEAAVEAKVVAVQRAAEAKNKTVQVKEEAEQRVLAAKADAEAMRIKSQALSQNKGLVAFEAVQKWNGILPVNMYGSAPLPFLNIKSE